MHTIIQEWYIFPSLSYLALTLDLLYCSKPRSICLYDLISSYNTKKNHICMSFPKSWDLSFKMHKEYMNKHWHIQTHKFFSRISRNLLPLGSQNPSTKWPQMTIFCNIMQNNLDSWIHILLKHFITEKNLYLHISIVSLSNFSGKKEKKISRKQILVSTTWQKYNSQKL